MMVLLPRSGMAGDPPDSIKIRIDDPLPYGRQPIDYHGHESNDAVARLNRQLEAGKVTLSYDAEHGYLTSLLDALKIPVASQMLVFSKTALHRRMVGPKKPRALYFNDEVSVGWVPAAAALEVSAFDPEKGARFYILRQQTDSPPRLQRQTRCLTCHSQSETLEIPGSTVRSVLTDEQGKPLAPLARITHQTDLSKRFGGWYVTGKHGNQTHSGNLIGEAGIRRQDDDPSFGANVTDLAPYFDASAYPAPHSDLVAHLVFHHQAHGRNLLTRVGYEARMNRRSNAEEHLLRYLLFADEAPLAAPVHGTSNFAEWFEKQGPADPHGRSLRRFDLKTRLFKYRLSYLVQTPAFDGLPHQVKLRLYRRLWEVLTGRDRAEDIQKIPREERQAIVEILRATKKDLPAYWRESDPTHTRGARRLP